MNRLNLVVAHLAEAQPLIERFGLERQAAPGRLYANDAGLTLILSGLGKGAAAAAVRRLAARQGADPDAPPAAWLNVGIAGHPHLQRGAGILALKIIEGASGRAWYPAPLLSGYRVGEVISVDRPERDYPLEAAYEMEAAGFWPAAVRAGPLELVQVYKIVSDNPTWPVCHVDEALAQRLVSERIDDMARLCRELQELVAAHNAVQALPPVCARALGMARFSVTRQHQLRQLCRRLVTLGLESQLEARLHQAGGSPARIIADLQAMLNEVGKAGQGR